MNTPKRDGFQHHTTHSPSPKSGGNGKTVTMVAIALVVLGVLAFAAWQYFPSTGFGKGGVPQINSPLNQGTGPASALTPSQPTSGVTT